MTILKPYRKNCRQFIDGTYDNNGQAHYILDPHYAKDPAHYIRAFLLIQKDLKKLFDYIDPSDTNLKSHSFRVHELLMRACTEVEANCKAILIENGYVKSGPIPMNMSDYNKLEKTHHLSSYTVKIPYWRGNEATRKPFINWEKPEKKKPDWYQAYHATKHDRHEQFIEANFENLIDAVSGLLVLLSSQFHTQDFSPGATSVTVNGYGINDGMEPAIGDYFRIQFPNWPENERYAFNYQDYQKNKNEADFFQSHDYQLIT